MEAARPALFGDLDACAQLIDDARAAAAELRGGADLLASSVAWKRGALMSAKELGDEWLHDPLRILFAGTFDDAVVGVAGGHLDGTDQRRAGYVDALYVDPGFRGVGVGSALAEALIAWFCAQGCAAVDAPALPGDRLTKQLFESMGLSARLLVLHRLLP